MLLFNSASRYSLYYIKEIASSIQCSRLSYKLKIPLSLPKAGLEVQSQLLLMSYHQSFCGYFIVVEYQKIYAIL
jgi:hypothetical protein